MKLRRLHYFLAVAEELHFGKAAERLAIKQPPLSRQIQILESNLGVKLFDRTKRHVELTPPGRYLKEAAAKLIAQADQIENTIVLMKEGTAGFARIGYVGSAMHCILPALLRDLQQCFPEIYPELFELGNDDQVRGLQSGELDIGFVRTPLHAEGLVTLPVLTETFSLILPADHRFAHDSSVTLGALADEPFIGFGRDCAPGMADQVLQICNEAGFSPRIVHTTSQFNALLRLVESGLGYSIVPSSSHAGYDLRLTSIDLVNVTQRAQLSAIYNPRYLSCTTKTIIELIERHSASQDVSPAPSSSPS